MTPLRVWVVPAFKACDFGTFDMNVYLVEREAQDVCENYAADSAEPVEHVAIPVTEWEAREAYVGQLKKELALFKPLYEVLADIAEGRCIGLERCAAEQALDIYDRAMSVMHEPPEAT